MTTSLANAFAVGYGQAVRSWLTKIADGDVGTSPGLGGRVTRSMGLRLLAPITGLGGAVGGHYGGKALATSGLGRRLMPALSAGGAKSKLVAGLTLGGAIIGLGGPLAARLGLRRRWFRRRQQARRQRLAGQGGGR